MKLLARLRKLVQDLLLAVLFLLYFGALFFLLPTMFQACGLWLLTFTAPFVAIVVWRAAKEYAQGKPRAPPPPLDEPKAATPKAPPTPPASGFVCLACGQLQPADARPGQRCFACGADLGGRGA